MPHTVTYGMPPEGYETVTLPESLVQRLDELDERSPTGTIRHLLAEYKGDSSASDTDLSEVLERLDRNYEATKEATNAAQANGKQLEEMK